MCCSVVRGKAVKNLVKFKGQIIADWTTITQVTSKGSGWKTSWKGMVKACWAQVTKVSRHSKFNDKWDEKVQNYKMWPSKAYGWNHSSSDKMIKLDKMFHKAATIWKKIINKRGKMMWKRVITTFLYKLPGNQDWSSITRGVEAVSMEASLLIQGKSK